MNNYGGKTARKSGFSVFYCNESKTRIPQCVILSGVEFRNGLRNGTKSKFCETQQSGVKQNRRGRAKHG